MKCMGVIYFLASVNERVVILIRNRVVLWIFFTTAAELDLQLE
jgi:hypothetical protein